MVHFKRHNPKDHLWEESPQNYISWFEVKELLLLAGNSPLHAYLIFRLDRYINRLKFLISDNGLVALGLLAIDEIPDGPRFLKSKGFFCFYFAFESEFSTAVISQMASDIIDGAESKPPFLNIQKICAKAPSKLPIILKYCKSCLTSTICQWEKTKPILHN